MVNGPACKAMSVKWEVSVRPSFEIALIFKSDWITQAQLHSREESWKQAAAEGRPGVFPNSEDGFSSVKPPTKTSV